MKNKIQKLTLNQETLRNLSQEEINKVAGGCYNDRMYGHLPYPQHLRDLYAVTLH